MGCRHSKKKPIKEERVSADFLRACVLTQQWYRVFKAKQNLRRLALWHLLQEIEYINEKQQLELFNFYNALIKYLPLEEMPNHESNPKNITWDVKIYDEPTFLKYNSPKINFPITTNEIKKLIVYFHKKEVPILHPAELCPILRLSAMHLKGLRNINIPTMANAKHITVVGNLHGSLLNLLVIFHKNGLPGLDNPYVFNGGFVDFGENSIEVLILILASFLAFPHAVYLNRGTHEDPVMNKCYGLVSEVTAKYGQNAKYIIHLIEEVFRWLPLGTIVFNRVLIIHGGLSYETDLQALRTLDRGKFASIIRPPYEESFSSVDWKQIFDVLWSDPRDFFGVKPNVSRGGGIFFGQDVTERFLRRNKLTLLVRSHECVLDGFEMKHNHKLVTLFSVSNFYAVGSNKGAYLRLFDDRRLHFVRYFALATTIQRMTTKHLLTGLIDAAIFKLGVKMQSKLQVLREEFVKNDQRSKGKIKIADWTKAMQRVTGMPNASWHLLVDCFGKRLLSKKHGMLVKYPTTLDILGAENMRLEYQKNWVRDDGFTADKAQLIAVFDFIDTNNSGTLTVEEFMLAWQFIEQYAPAGRKKADILKLFKKMDYNKDGEINLQEFLDAFNVLIDNDKAVRRNQASLTDPKITRYKKLDLDNSTVEQLENAQTKSDDGKAVRREQASLTDPDITQYTPLDSDGSKTSIEEKRSIKSEDNVNKARDPDLMIDDCIQSVEQGAAKDSETKIKTKLDKNREKNLGSPKSKTVRYLLEDKDDSDEENAVPLKSDKDKNKNIDKVDKNKAKDKANDKAKDKAKEKKN